MFNIYNLKLNFIQFFKKVKKQEFEADFERMLKNPKKKIKKNNLCVLLYELIFHLYKNEYF